MDIDVTSITDTSPGCYFILTPTDEADAIKACRDEIISHLDNTNQIQSEILLEKVLDDSDLFQSVIEEAKIGSRYGKSVIDLYSELLKKEIESDDDLSLAENIEEQYQQYGGSASNSGVVGEPINVGINIGERIEKRVSALGSNDIEFTEADLTVAVGIAVNKRAITTENKGAVIIKSERSISDLKRYGKIGTLSRMMNDILVSGLSVVVIAPDGGTDESEIINDTFRSVGQLTINYAEPTGIEVSVETTEWINEWYDRLCFDIAPGRISQRTARRAAIVAHDLPDKEEATHFRRSIIHGLQWEYSNQQLANHKDDFDELWDENIKPHQKYDYRRSQRNSFPRVKIGRDDGRVRWFELRHRGPRNQIELDGIPIENNPVRKLIEKILQFLDGKDINEAQWANLKKTVSTSLVDPLNTTPGTLVAEALLKQNQLPPKSADIPRASGGSMDNSIRKPEWYEKHWREILAEPTVRSRVGSNLIENKIKLQKSLKGEYLGGTSLHYKLQEDINRAEENYVEELSEEISQGVVDHISLDIAKNSFDKYEEVTYHAETVDGRERMEHVKIKTPYSDVRISEEKISPATIDNVAEIIIDHFEPLFQVDPDLSSPADILVPLTDLYIEIENLSQGDLLYFDHFIDFCVTLPGVVDRFEGSKSAAEAIREHLTDDEIMLALRDRSSRFHLSGNDPYEGIRTSVGEYVAMELESPT
jgi:hypothetical protein